MTATAYPAVSSATTPFSNALLPAARVSLQANVFASRLACFRCTTKRKQPNFSPATGTLAHRRLLLTHSRAPPPFPGQRLRLAAGLLPLHDASPGRLRLPGGRRAHPRHGARARRSPRRRLEVSKEGRVILGSPNRGEHLDARALGRERRRHQQLHYTTTLLQLLLLLLLLLYYHHTG